MNDAPVLKGLVLAGGQSRRMGSDKALLLHDGRSQLAYTMALLGQFTSAAYVSTSKALRDETERASFPQIVDRYDDLGPVAGILSAMDTDPQAAWLVVAVDLPNIDDRTLGFLVESRNAAQPFSAFRSSHNELPEPLCAVYEPSARAIIDDFVAQGIVCPRKIMIRSDTCLLNQPNANALDNMNTPDDLARSDLQVAQ
ncbi:molybdenum cofactor guanylyltransferase [Woeseia oceani]|nr:NTP transferase domain-containing protein [Woeseia oceani]